MNLYWYINIIYWLYQWWFIGHNIAILYILKYLWSHVDITIFHLSATWPPATSSRQGWVPSEICTPMMQRSTKRWRPPKRTRCQGGPETSRLWYQWCKWMYHQIARHIYIYVCMYIYIYTHTYVSMYIYIYICICIHVHVCIYTHICTNICMYMYTYIYIYIYVHYMRSQQFEWDNIWWTSKSRGILSSDNSTLRKHESKFCGSGFRGTFSCKFVPYLWQIDRDGWKNGGKPDVKLLDYLQTLDGLCWGLL